MQLPCEKYPSRVIQEKASFIGSVDHDLVLILHSILLQCLSLSMVDDTWSCTQLYCTEMNTWFSNSHVQNSAMCSMMRLYCSLHNQVTGYFAFLFHMYTCVQSLLLTLSGMSKTDTREAHRQCERCLERGHDALNCLNDPHPKSG